MISPTHDVKQALNVLSATRSMRYTAKVVQDWFNSQTGDVWILSKDLTKEDVDNYAFADINMQIIASGE